MGRGFELLSRSRITRRSLTQVSSRANGVCVGGGHEKHARKENNSVETDTRHSHSHLTEATSHKAQQPKRIKKCIRDVHGGGPRDGEISAQKVTHRKMM